MLKIGKVSAFVRIRRSLKIFIFLAIGLGLSVTFWACTFAPNENNPAPTENQNQKQENVLRIGYQKSGLMTNLIKAKGILEKRLASSDFSVEWIEFSAGPPILEAMGAGRVNFGYTGEAPPVFAQAAGVPLVYIANEPDAPETSAILVLKESPIRTLAQLKGKAVAVTKASSAHYMLVRSLAKARLPIDEIKPVYLSQEEGQKALDSKQVDAWVAWDPYFAAAQRKNSVRAIADGKGLVKIVEYYLADRSFASKHPDLIKAIVEEIQAMGNWTNKNRRAAAEILSPQMGVDVATLEIFLKRVRYGAQPIQDRAIAEQQRIADTFFRLGLLPQQIRVKDALLRGS